MRSLRRRLVSVLVVAGMLLTSVDCVCGAGAMPGPVPVPEKQPVCHMRHHGPMACCEGGGDHDAGAVPARQDDAGRHAPACHHCQASRLLDPASSRNLTHLFDWALAGPCFMAGGINSIAAPALNIQSFTGDFPPPVGPPTLLSLGCALTI